MREGQKRAGSVASDSGPVITDESKIEAETRKEPVHKVLQLIVQAVIPDIASE